MGDKENFNPLVYDSRMSDVAQDSTFGAMHSPFPAVAATKSERKFANIAHGTEPDEKMTKLVQENFDLRLHCYHLKEKLDKITNGADVSTDLNRIAYLESRVESLTRELEVKRHQLAESAEALNQLDRQLKSAELERDNAETRCAKLREQLDNAVVVGGGLPLATNDSNASASAANAAAPGASTSAGGGSGSASAAAPVDLQEQRIIKMAGLLQGSWRRQEKLESRLAKAEAEAARLKELESAAEEFGFNLAELPDRVAELNKELEAANASLTEAGAVIENLQAQLNEGKAENEELNQLLDEYRQEVASLNAEKAAAASSVPSTAASQQHQRNHRAVESADAASSSTQRSGGGGGGGVDIDEAGSFWESVRLGAINRRSLTIGSNPATATTAAAGPSSSVGGGSGVSALADGLGALSLMPAEQQQQAQLTGISEEARQCLNASGKRFYHLCVTSLASSGAAPAIQTPTDANEDDLDNVGAMTEAAGQINAEISVSELTGPGLIDQVSHLRTHSLPMSMDAAAGMSAAELGQLKGVFDRLLGQLRGAEAGLQAALSTTLGNVSALLGSAALLANNTTLPAGVGGGGGGASFYRASSIRGGLSATFAGVGVDEEDSFAGGVPNRVEDASSLLMTTTGGAGQLYPPNTPGLRSMEEENALAMRNLQDHVAEVKQALTGFGRIGCMLEALLAGAVAEASSLHQDQEQQQQQQFSDYHRQTSFGGQTSLQPDQSCQLDEVQHQRARNQRQQRRFVDFLDTDAEEWATPPSPPPTTTATTAASAASGARPKGLSVASTLTDVTSNCPDSGSLAMATEAVGAVAAASVAEAHSPPSLRLDDLVHLVGQPGPSASLSVSTSRSSVAPAVSASAVDSLKAVASVEAQTDLLDEEERDMAARCRSLQAELANATSRADRLQSELADALDEAQQAQTEAQKLAANCDALRNEMAELAGLAQLDNQAESDSAYCEKSAQLAELEAQLALAKAAQSESENKVAELNAQLESALARLKQAECGLAEKTAQLESAESELQLTKSNLEQVEADLIETANQLETTEAELDAAKSTVHQLNSDLESKTAQLESVEVELDSMKSKYERFETEANEQSARLQSDLELARSNVELLEANLAEKVSELESVESELSLAKSSMEQMETELVKKATQLESAKSELSAAKSSIEHMEAELVEKAAQLESAESDLSTARSSVEQMEAELVEKANQLKAAETELTTVKSNIERIEAELAEKVTQLESAKSNFEQLETELSSKTAQLESADAELNQLREKLGLAQVQAEAARADNAATETVLANLRDRCAKLEVAMQASEAAGAKMKKKIDNFGQTSVQEAEQRQKRQSHAAEMAEVLASYRELTSKCERAVSLSVELQTRAEELRAKLTSRTKRLESVQKSNSQLKAMLKKSDDTCNQLSLELKATKLEIEDKTALTEKLLRYISRLGAPHPGCAVGGVGAVSAAAEFDPDELEGSLSTNASSSSHNSTAVGGADSVTPQEAARACSPSPAPGDPSSVGAAAAAAAAAAWPEVIQAEITLHDALARVSNCGLGLTGSATAPGNTADPSSGPLALARELRRALKDLRHLRARLSQSLAESRRLAGQLAEVDGRTDELASLRRQTEALRRENDELKAARSASAAVAEESSKSAAAAANSESQPTQRPSAGPQHAVCRLDRLELLRLEVAECRRAVDQAVSLATVANSNSNNGNPDYRQIRRELANAARCSAAAVAILSEDFVVPVDDADSMMNDFDGEFEYGRLEAVKAESRQLRQRAVDVQNRLLTDPLLAKDGDLDDVAERDVAASASLSLGEFSDRLSTTETLLATAKQRLLQAQQHNASL